MIPLVPKLKPNEDPGTRMYWVLDRVVNLLASVTCVDPKTEELRKRILRDCREARKAWDQRS